MKNLKRAQELANAGHYGAAIQKASIDVPDLENHIRTWGKYAGDLKKQHSTHCLGLVLETAKAMEAS